MSAQQADARERLSVGGADYAPPLPETIEIAQKRDHLKIDGGVLRCSECGSHVTIDARTHIEYGHRRQSYREQRPGRCTYRPDRLDKNR